MKAVLMRQYAMRKTAFAAACALLASLVAVPAGVAQTRAAVSMGAAPQLINLPRGTSFAVDLPADARDVIVSNPQVAEAMLHSPRRITVIGIAPGETDAVFLDAAGRTILSLRVRVDAGTSALQDTLSRVAPGGQIHAEAVNDSVILTGFADTPAQAAQATRVAAAFVSAPEKVINMISVVGSDQVTLKVRVVEIQRSTLKQLGFGSDILNGAGIHSYGFSRPNTYGVNGAPLGGSSLCYNQAGGQTTNGSTSNSSTGTTVDGGLTNTISNIASTAFRTMTGTNASGCLEAFERVGLARTLAEPNLTSVNGEAANFLAGGEFPLPSGRDRDGNITVTYKPYGVGLAFRPVVLSGGRISLQVKVEVSELTSQGGFTIGAGTPSSITLPGLSVRRSENTVELPSGGSMMIAGLLQESTRQTVDSLPGVTNLPVLGSLFRSRDYLMGETELVVIVEPYIVSPTSPDRMQTPADGLRIASDSQTILFGQLNQVYGLPNAPPAGSVGYVIE
ncbi:type II and III secretion system protein family protein [Brevundimonas sp. G8]|uniref:type II and III secretion system protein family protein n=1 Tax=Brevundimonas sp. G8 TaxID=1350776 RepID=UPI0012F2B8FD|nr:type II and III secretion system protein family protein [Brevundimonas sp. G8]VXC09186.1 Type II/IV secretion system secretin RcpA/CpaC, associated with Flp pilus assembly [Brevundimonas sp. G8]